MSVETEIKQAVEKNFTVSHLNIINESNKHIGHAGHDGSGESHFKLLVVSDDFEGLNRVQRHRAINEALKDLYNKGLHALSLKLFAKSEYKS